MSIGYAANDLPYMIQTAIVETGIEHIRNQLNVISSKYCKECGDEISKERLKFIRTNLCISCKEDEEKWVKRFAK